MTHRSDDYLIVGKIGAPFGVKGWVKIQSFTEQTIDILDYSPWYIEEGPEWKLTKVEAGQGHGKGVIAKLSGLSTPEEASLWAGKHIAIKQTQLPKLAKGEYYWSDLKGLTVIDQNGQTLGTVSHLIETGGNDVLVVKGEKEQAIPYLPGTVIKEVDLAKQIIYVNWDEI